MSREQHWNQCAPITFKGNRRHIPPFAMDGSCSQQRGMSRHDGCSRLGACMPTVLCLDDFTCGLAEATQALREAGYWVLAADDSAAALDLAAETRLDAVLLNCQCGTDNSGLVTALRILQPHAAVLMFSGYCGVPCDQLHLADACLQKGRTPSTLLPLLRAVLCQSRYGLCRWVAA